MVGVAQSAEPQLVELAVAGSSPVAHPNKNQILVIGFEYDYSVFSLR